MPGKRTKTNDWFYSKKKKYVLNHGLCLFEIISKHICN